MNIRLFFCVLNGIRTQVIWCHNYCTLELDVRYRYIFDGLQFLQSR